VCFNPQDFDCQDGEHAGFVAAAHLLKIMHPGSLYPASDRRKGAAAMSSVAVIPMLLEKQGGGYALDTHDCAGVVSGFMHLSTLAGNFHPGWHSAV
jgi:hypothetical protein